MDYSIRLLKNFTCAVSRKYNEANKNMFVSTDQIVFAGKFCKNIPINFTANSLASVDALNALLKIAFGFNSTPHLEIVCLHK